MQWEVSQFLNTDPSYNFLETETKITNPSPKSESRGNTGYDNVHSIYSCKSNSTTNIRLTLPAAHYGQG